MSITDAFFAFTLDAPPGTEQPTFPEWLSRLSYQLINNDFDQMSLQSPPSGSRRTPPVAAARTLQSHEEHQLMNLSILTPFNQQINPRRQCSVKGCTRKTELYCADCSIIDHTNGHRLFYCCGVGQRVTADRRQTIDGTNNPKFETIKVTQPLCYKFHLDHLHDEPSDNGESDCSDSSML
jgi:hypothetical protein